MAGALLDLYHLRELPSPSDFGVIETPAMPGVVAGMTQFTRPVSFLGLPALAQPIGFSAEGLPIAMQLVGRPIAENRPLEIGVAYDRDRFQGSPASAEPSARDSRRSLT